MASVMEWFIRTIQQSVTRTLSARYYKDGAEILIDRGWDMATGEKRL